jgi:zinc protease
VVIVGDLDRAQAEALAARVVGDLPPGEPAPSLPAPERAEAGGVTVVAHPSTQTHLRLGHPAIRRGHPDYFPLLVGNHALGGNGLVSLLAQAVREERGLSYAISSGLTPMQEAGPFRVTLQTRNARIAEAVEVVRETLAGFIAEGPPAEDLALAKDNLVGGFPLRIDSNAQVASYLSMIGFYDLPLDWLATWTDRVEAVTGEAVRDAFRRHLDLGAMRLVLVGDVPPAQREQVEALFGGAPQGVETAAR